MHTKGDGISRSLVFLNGGGNVKMTAIDLFAKVSPGIGDSLQSTVDVAHRLGQKNANIG